MLFLIINAYCYHIVSIIIFFHPTISVYCSRLYFSAADYEGGEDVEVYSYSGGHETYRRRVLQHCLVLKEVYGVSFQRMKSWL